MGYQAPFPYFGGKTNVADVVWQRLGADVRNYVEPFFGSGAVLLARPGWSPDASIYETANDASGFVSNFWRALQHDPEKVAHYADWPVNENDLHARHAWLVQNHLVSLAARLEGDPDYYDAKIAGWWVWGMSIWIGGGFCSGNGSWQSVEQEDGTRVFTKSGDADMGVHRQRVHLNEGMGVKRKRVHLGSADRGVGRPRVHLSRGMGVKRQIVHLADAGMGVKLSDAGTGEAGLYAWMHALAERLQRVRVCCGDWRRVTGNTPTVVLGTTAVFLDPPYSAESGRDNNLYEQESFTVAHDVREWAIEHGDDPRYRIALCGYDTEHTMPAGWSMYRWSTGGGYSNQSFEASNGKKNRHREVVWFSPHCLPAPNGHVQIEQAELLAWR